MGQNSWTLERAAQDAYLAVCTRAVNGEGLGAFKRDPAYRAVLEHVTEAQGRAYLETIKAENPQLLHYFKLFQENDKHGAPFTFNYDGRVFSPSTVRYVKVASDLLTLFGPLDDFDIVEIGAGYGGQCKIIGDIWAWRSYTLVDLPAAVELQRKYLSTLGVSGFECKTPDELEAAPCDLAISNYAFSELDREGRRFYEETVFRHAARGYVTWNSREPFARAGDGIDVEVDIRDEQPKTGQFNKTVSWGSQ